MTKKQANVVRFRLLHLMLFIAAVGVLVASIRTPYFQYLNNRGHGEWTPASPFTDVQVEGDVAVVEFRGARYKLVSINKASTKEILRSARRR